MILGLDASSTVIGWCMVDSDNTALAHGELPLSAKLDINTRATMAHLAIANLLRDEPRIQAVAIESPVARYAKAVIPQALVSGAIRAACGLRGLMVVDVTPQEAKHRLCQSGSASKDAMQQAASAYGVSGEHASDSLAVALVGLTRIVIEEVV